MISEIEDQLPPDWKPSAIEAKNDSKDREQKNTRLHPPSIYNESFAWRRNETLASTVIYQINIQLNQSDIQNSDKDTKHYFCITLQIFGRFLKWKTIN